MTERAETYGDARSDSAANDAARVPITIVAGILGCTSYLAGTVLAIWSYVRNGFDLSDWRFWLGYGLLAVGIGVFVWLLQWNRDSDRLDPAVRRTLYGYNIFLGVMFLGALLILGNILVTQYGGTFGLKPFYDWTSQKVFTLGEVSINQAKSLEKPVKIIALYQRVDPRAMQLEQLFQLYAGANKQITYEFLDLAEDRLQLEDFFKKYPDALVRGQGGFLEPSIIVIYGTGDDAPHKVVKDSEIFKVDLKEMDMFSGERGGDHSFFGENAVTSAIRSLVEEKKTAVFFTTGHGELDLNNSDVRSQDALNGIGSLRQRLTDLNVKTESVNLLRAEVPSDADILVIAGPHTGFEAPEVQKIRDFMDRKNSTGQRTGRLLVLLDSAKEFDRGAPHDAGLGELLASLNVDAKDNLVYDVDYRVSNMPDQFAVDMASETPAHAIVSSLSNRAGRMFRAREIAPLTNPHPPGVPGVPPEKYQVAKLFSTSAEGRSWAQADYESRPSLDAPGNTRGPVCLGVAVSEGGGPPPQQNPFGGPPPAPPKSTPVAVVIGDSTFASNVLVAQRPENEALFLNCVNWLGGRMTELGIQPRVKKYARLDLESAGVFTMSFEPFFHMVAIAAFIAGLIWVHRSDRLQLVWVPIVGTLIWLALYGLLAILVIGPPSSLATRGTIMRVFLTCLVLWTIGVTFLMARSRPARTAESV